MEPWLRGACEVPAPIKDTAREVCKGGVFVYTLGSCCAAVEFVQEFILWADAIYPTSLQ